MALSSTPYKFSVALSNTDAHVYTELKFVIARHPSETEDRMITRLIAYLFWYHEHLEFGRGLSDTGEAALWEVALDGQVEHWIDVGLPDAERMTKASRKGQRYSVLVYGNRRIWVEKVLPKVVSADMQIFAVPDDTLAQIKALLSRNMKLDLTIADGTFYLSILDSNSENQSIVFQLITLI